MTRVFHRLRGLRGEIMTEIEELRKEVEELKERVELMDMLRDLQKRMDEHTQYKPFVVPMPYPVYLSYPRPYHDPRITYTSSWVAT
jgi:hypothetical protein